MVAGESSGSCPGGLGSLGAEPGLGLGDLRGSARKAEELRLGLGSLVWRTGVGLGVPTLTRLRCC